MIIIKYIKILISFLFISIYFLFNQNLYKNSNVNAENNKNIDENAYYNIHIDNLKSKYNNDDIIGLLKINNSDFEIPIVQGEDNEYYLNHTLANEEKEEGAIFLDYRISIDNSKKLLIYGHNSSKYNLPFKCLENYYEKEYYKNHKYIKLITGEVERLYEIFSVYVETFDFSYMNINFVDSKDFYKHISDLKDKSLYDTGIELNQEDEILILQTCSNHIDYLNYDKKYLLIISRRVE